MQERFEAELPDILKWQPGVIYDPIPEWWIRGLDVRVQAELIAIRLETTQKILQVQAEGLATAAKVLRSQGQ